MMQNRCSSEIKGMSTYACSCARDGLEAGFETFCRLKNSSPKLGKCSEFNSDC